MPLLEQIILYICLAIFLAGLLFMHIRLRNKSSLTVIISFSFFSSWLYLRSWLFNLYAYVVTEPAPAVQGTAEAFNRLPSYDSFDFIFAAGILVSIFVFCLSFFLAAKSIPASNYAIKGTSA